MGEIHKLKVISLFDVIHVLILTQNTTQFKHNSNSAKDRTDVNLMGFEYLYCRQKLYRFERGIKILWLNQKKRKS